MALLVSRIEGEGCAAKGERTTPHAGTLARRAARQLYVHHPARGSRQAGIFD
jgi:hypothetical protein